MDWSVKMPGSTEVLAQRSGDGPVRSTPPERTRSALDMIADCFRHQHPEAFGRPPVPGAVVPNELRYGRDDLPVAAPTGILPEEPMGDPQAAPLP
jgi:hypothetical protein